METKQLPPPPFAHPPTRAAAHPHHWQAKRSPDKLFEVFDIMSAYRCPASALVARNAAAKKTASSGKVYDAELFRRLAHNYGSVVDVIAPGAAGGERDDFFRGDDGARGSSETASSLETRVRSSFLCLLYSFVCSSYFFRLLHSIPSRSSRRCSSSSSCDRATC